MVWEAEVHGIPGSGWLRTGQISQGKSRIRRRSFSPDHLRYAQPGSLPRASSMPQFTVWPRASRYLSLGLNFPVSPKALIQILWDPPVQLSQLLNWSRIYLFSHMLVYPFNLPSTYLYIYPCLSNVLLNTFALTWYLPRVVYTLCYMIYVWCYI